MEEDFPAEERCYNSDFEMSRTFHFSCSALIQSVFHGPVHIG